MNSKTIRVKDIDVANDKPFVLFAGMNVLESRDLAMQVAEHHVTVTQKLGISPRVFGGWGWTHGHEPNNHQTNEKRPTIHHHPPPSTTIYHPPRQTTPRHTAPRTRIQATINTKGDTGMWGGQHTTERNTNLRHNAPRATHNRTDARGGGGTPKTIQKRWVESPPPQNYGQGGGGGEGMLLFLMKLSLTPLKRNSITGVFKRDFSEPFFQQSFEEMNRKFSILSF